MSHVIIHTGLASFAPTFETIELREDINRTYMYMTYNIHYYIPRRGLASFAPTFETIEIYLAGRCFVPKYHHFAPSKVTRSLQYIYMCI